MVQFTKRNKLCIQYHVSTTNSFVFFISKVAMWILRTDCKQKEKRKENNTSLDDLNFTFSPTEWF